MYTWEQNIVRGSWYDIYLLHGQLHHPILPAVVINYTTMETPSIPCVSYLWYDRGKFVGAIYAVDFTILLEEISDRVLEWSSWYEFQEQTGPEEWLSVISMLVGELVNASSEEEKIFIASVVAVTIADLYAEHGASNIYGAPYDAALGNMEIALDLHEDGIKKLLGEGAGVTLDKCRLFLRAL